MEIFDNGPGQLNQLSSTPSISTVAGVEYRGSTSQADFYFLPGYVKNHTVLNCGRIQPV